MSKTATKSPGCGIRAPRRPWYVKFDDSPCAEGKEFGSDRAKTCTIKVACHAKGDAGCNSYSYNSATGATASMQDPHVVVDP